MLLAEVSRGLYVHRTSGGRYYLRLGSTKRDLTPPELARLFQQRGPECVFAEQPVLAATVDHLTRHQLEAFFGRSPTIRWLDLLRNTRVTLRDERGVDRPTVARLLTFGTEPTDFLPSGSIAAACYSGERLSSDDLVGRRAPRRPDARPDRLRRRLRRPVHAAPHARQTRGQLGPGVRSRRRRRGNRQCRRSPRLRHLRIEAPLFLFADRLELYSPGGLPNTITLDDMPYRTFTRNQLLFSFLSRIRSTRSGQVFPESRGEGVRKILRDGEPHSGRRPEYALFSDEVRLILWAKSRPQTD